MKHQVPSELDWGDWQADLDQQYAHDLYAGRSNDELLDHFCSGPIEASDELLFMPKIPFQYYVLGFRDSVLARAHIDITDLASAAACFLKLLEARYSEAAEDFVGLTTELLPAAEFIAAHQKSFGADVDIYGDFAAQVGRIRGHLKDIA